MEKTTTLPGESSLDGTRTHGHFTTTLEMSAAEVEPAQAPGGVQVSIQEIADKAVVGNVCRKRALMKKVALPGAGVKNKKRKNARQTTPVQNHFKAKLS